MSPQQTLQGGRGAAVAGVRRGRGHQRQRHAGGWAHRRPDRGCAEGHRFAVSAYELAEILDLVPSEIDQVTAKIIDSVNAAKTELLNEIDEITAAEIDACRDRSR
ncbi:MAG TPA: hypothetical protein VFT95_21930 [Micromonosporaceae bacterium]|nr:hypothetical protein [Micromonosporaceae bacterium]